MGKVRRLPDPSPRYGRSAVDSSCPRLGGLCPKIRNEHNIDNFRSLKLRNEGHKPTFWAKLLGRERKPWTDVPLQLATKCLNDVAILRKIAGLELRVDQCIIQADLEASAIGWHQLKRSEVLAECIHYRFCEAHGLRHVVSTDAIFDGDFFLLLCHAGCLPSNCWYMPPHNAEGARTLRRRALPFKYRRPPQMSRDTPKLSRMAGPRSSIIEHPLMSYSYCQNRSCHISFLDSPPKVCYMVASETDTHRVRQAA